MLASITCNDSASNEVDEAFDQLVEHMQDYERIIELLSYFLAHTWSAMGWFRALLFFQLKHETIVKRPLTAEH